MAKFLDVKLKGEKGLSDDDAENILDKVMVLFRCKAWAVCCGSMPPVTITTAAQFLPPPRPEIALCRRTRGTHPGTKVCCS